MGLGERGVKVIRDCRHLGVRAYSRSRVSGLRGPRG